MRVQTLFTTALQPPVTTQLLLGFCSAGEDLGEELGETFSPELGAGWHLLFLGAVPEVLRFDRLCRQYFAISLVARCSQFRSPASRTISTAANHFGALGAGSPSGVNLPELIKIGMSCSANPSSLAVCITSNRAGKFRVAQVATAI